MTTASVCTIGDEILIGQIVDTNSPAIARALQDCGIKVEGMVSIGDDRKVIISTLKRELKKHDIVIVTGGLGPTKDDITKTALARLSGSKGSVVHPGQLAVVHDILASRGLDMLESNRLQASVPDTCEVIVNPLGTAPIMVFRFPAERFGHPATLYSLPGVPHEALGALPPIMEDIHAHYALDAIHHKSIMTFGMAESALSEFIAPWEDDLPADMHLAYLPHLLTGVKLRLSIYGGRKEEAEKRIDEAFARLKPMLGDKIYAEQEDDLQHAVGRLLRGTGRTLSCAESCTGGTIAALLTSVPGASEYFLGSVTSYAVSVKEKVLGVPPALIKEKGVVSSEVAAAMAEGVRRLTGSTFAVATTGLAGPGGDEHNPVGTVWIGVAGPAGTQTFRKQYHNDRKRNIERFSAAALDCLRLAIKNS